MAAALYLPVWMAAALYLPVWMAAALYLPVWMAAALYLPVWMAAALYLPVWMAAALYLPVWMAAAETKMMMQMIVEAVVRLMLTVHVVKLKIGGESAATLWQPPCFSGRQLVQGRCALAQAQNLQRACAPLQQQHGEEMREPCTAILIIIT